MNGSHCRLYPARDQDKEQGKRDEGRVAEPEVCILRDLPDRAKKRLV
jgi:hypothetical protein